MKFVISLLFIIAIAVAFGQSSESFDLRWKIQENDTLSYSTVMSELDTSTIDIDFGQFFNLVNDSTNESISKSLSTFEKINQMMMSIDYVVYMINSGKGVIDITMNTPPIELDLEDFDLLDESDSSELSEAKMMSMMQSLNQGVMLRGTVYETGDIESFWLKTSQKNLIAILFQLPNEPVQINEPWTIDVQLIANDQNFKCDSSYRVNEVKIVEVKEVNGEQIAIIKYNVIEFVNGDFHRPSFSDKVEDPVETMLRYSIQGVSEFSIDKGRWVNYNAILSIDATGIMTANKKTRFSLIPKP